MRRKRNARGLWNWLRGRKETVGIEWTRPASGLVTALDPVMRATGGTWIAHGSGNADRETADARGRVMVPPDRPSYTLRRIWLSPEEEQGYYYDCANNAQTVPKIVTSGNVRTPASGDAALSRCNPTSKPSPSAIPKC